MFDEMFRQMRKMQREMDEMFNEWHGFTRHALLPGKASKEIQNWSPAATDVEETDKLVVARFDMPGIEKDDIKLDVTENSITVRAERKTGSRDEKKGMLRHERSYSGFYRSFGLPAKVVAEKADAEYKNGVLTVKVPKAELPKERRTKRIEIK